MRRRPEPLLSDPHSRNTKDPRRQVLFGLVDMVEAGGIEPPSETRRA